MQSKQCLQVQKFQFKTKNYVCGWGNWVIMYKAKFDKIEVVLL